jgi:hypothetical protein
MSDENAALARRVVEILTRSEEDRAVLIGRLAQREDTTALAKLLLDIETDPTTSRGCG